MELNKQTVLALNWRKHTRLRSENVTFSQISCVSASYIIRRMDWFNTNTHPTTPFISWILLWQVKLKQTTTFTVFGRTLVWVLVLILDLLFVDIQSTLGELWIKVQITQAGQKVFLIGKKVAKRPESRPTGALVIPVLSTVSWTYCGTLVIPVLSFTYKPTNPETRFSLAHPQIWPPRWCKL